MVRTQDSQDLDDIYLSLRHLVLFIVLLFGLCKVEDKNDNRKQDGKEPAQTHGSGEFGESGGSGESESGEQVEKRKEPAGVLELNPLSQLVSEAFHQHVQGEVAHVTRCSYLIFPVPDVRLGGRGVGKGQR